MFNVLCRRRSDGKYWSGPSGQVLIDRVIPTLSIGTGSLHCLGGYLLRISIVLDANASSLSSALICSARIIDSKGCQRDFDCCSKNRADYKHQQLSDVSSILGEYYRRCLECQGTAQFQVSSYPRSGAMKLRQATAAIDCHRGLLPGLASYFDRSWSSCDSCFFTQAHVT